MAKQQYGNYTVDVTGNPSSGGYGMYSMPSSQTATYKGRQINMWNSLSDEAKQKALQQIDEAEAGAQTQQLVNQAGQQQQQLATQFRQNLPQYSGLLQDQANKTIQRNLAEKMQGLKEQSARRGFLSGTGTQKQQAEALVGAGQETQQKKFDIQDTLEKQAQTFENQALATKLSQQGVQNQAYIDQLRQDILNNQTQTELWKALGQAAGPSIGYYMAKKSGGNQ